MLTVISVDVDEATPLFRQIRFIITKQKPFILI